MHASRSWWAAASSCLASAHCWMAAAAQDTNTFLLLFRPPEGKGKNNNRGSGHGKTPKFCFDHAARFVRRYIEYIASTTTDIDDSRVHHCCKPIPRNNIFAHNGNVKKRKKRVKRAIYLSLSVSQHKFWLDEIKKLNCSGTTLCSNAHTQR